MTTTNKTTAIKSRKHALGSSRTLAFTSASLITGFAMALPTDAMAVENTTTTTTLAPVQVEADAIGSYKTNTLSSAKFTQPLQDTPQTIQIISRELFHQQGATTLTDALRNSPGVGTFFAGENGNTNTGDTIYMRGFDTSSSLFVDGVRDLGSISRDLFNIEQVEITKGPAGTDNGRSAPTGAINMVSKQAFLRDQTAGSVSAGFDGQKRATLDVNRTFAALAGSAFRLNALWQDSDVPGRDHVKNSRVGFAPSLGFGLDGATRAYLNLSHVKQDNIPDGFVPTIGLPGWSPQPGLEQLVDQRVDPENFYGTRQDHDDVTANMITFRIEHDMSDAVRLTNTLRWGRTEQNYLLSAFMSTGGTSADPQAGNIKWTDSDDLSTYTLARSLNTFKDQSNEILTDQLNLRLDFATGDITHNLSTGVEWTREQQDIHGITSNGSRPAASLYAPDWNDVGDLSWYRDGSGSKGETDTTSVYMFDTAKFGKHFLVTGGIRADHYDTEYNSSGVCTTVTPVPRRGIACPPGIADGGVVSNADLAASDTLFNWKLGVVYKPTEVGSFYLNYAVSQQPPGGANFQLSSAANAANNPNMDPQKAKTLEVGNKWSLLDDALALNLAWFRTQVTNEINTQDLDDSGNPTQTGKKQVQGIEVSAVGNITANWSVSAGYSHLDTSVENGANLAEDGSSNLTYTPEDAFTAWSTYIFPFGLSVGGGVRYSGEMLRGTDGAVGTPAFTRSYTVYDAVVFYPLGDNLTVRLNAYNLFDKEYVAAINKSGYRYTPGVPRTFLLSADFRF